MDMVILIAIIIAIIVLNLKRFSKLNSKPDWRHWRQFAASNNLHFKSGVNITDTKIYGDFQGYRLSIYNNLKRKGQNSYRKDTNFVIERNKTLTHFEKLQTDRDIMDRFWVIFKFINSGLHIEITAKKIIFKSDLIIEGIKLQSISNQLVNFAEILPEVCKIGGKIVDTLLQVKPFKPITWHIIKSVCSETELRIKYRIDLLLCKRCFTFCFSHQVKAPIKFFTISEYGSNEYGSRLSNYYGCRLCRQNDLIEGRSIAVLDNQVTEEWSVRENEIFVNWLAYRKLFDFHEVRIMQATDRDVEEFAMQVGNDTDKLRNWRYKVMPCIISSGCKLSANTRNILKHTFKSVKEM